MEEIDRQHIVRICRDRCIDMGYSGKAFNDCVDRCVRENLNSES